MLMTELPKRDQKIAELGLLSVTLRMKNECDLFFN